jgi:predicted porin
MQKKLIALAVASLASGAAFAQTNVTMYGIADAGYVYSQGDAAGSGTNKFSGIQSGLLSGSRLGFKGEEALGNGLKAIFTLEYSLNIDNNTGVGSGSGGLNARQQFVGLAGGFGTVALGRQYAPATRPRPTMTRLAAPLLNRSRT